MGLSSACIKRLVGRKVPRGAYIAGVTIPAGWFALDSGNG